MAVKFHTQLLYIKRKSGTENIGHHKNILGRYIHRAGDNQ